MSFAASPKWGEIYRAYHLLFCKPGPTALTSASEPLAAALGGKVGPPVVRVLTLAPPTPYGICVVGKATIHSGSNLYGTPDRLLNFLLVIPSTMEGIPCSLCLPTPSSTPSASPHMRTSLKRNIYVYKFGT